MSKTWSSCSPAWFENDSKSILCFNGIKNIWSHTQKFTVTNVIYCEFRVIQILSFFCHDSRSVRRLKWFRFSLPLRFKPSNHDWISLGGFRWFIVNYKVERIRFHFESCKDVLRFQWKSKLHRMLKSLVYFYLFIIIIQSCNDSD